MLRRQGRCKPNAIKLELLRRRPFSQPFGCKGTIFLANIVRLWRYIYEKQEKKHRFLLFSAFECDVASNHADGVGMDVEERGSYLLQTLIRFSASSVFS